MGNQQTMTSADHEPPSSNLSTQQDGSSRPPTATTPMGGSAMTPRQSAGPPSESDSDSDSDSTTAEAPGTIMPSQSRTQPTTNGFVRFMVFLAGPMVLAAAGTAEQITKETADVSPKEMGGDANEPEDCPSLSMTLSKYAAVASLGLTAGSVLTVQHPLNSALLTGM
eukprot:gnl/TRDRNA2_/TRDRNA2_36037_c0_seq1.p1 gnl/TRDRNA2_/TRDRNA2_36037_c0~~gnl/TRDRNA2_/TRDRNA2_36037_c0_seq1.p1  ORF type:complete len:167 (+),score=22.76 gnl/TRDRNA2_/TRDRNA2_36037_c0_seq1:77-577(+)